LGWTPTKIGNNPTIILDGAHNPAGMRQLVRNIKSIYTYKKLIIVLGILYDKEIKKMVRSISEIADIIVISKSQSHRAAAIETLEREVKKTGTLYYKFPNSISAFKHAKKIVDRDDLICVSGSLYTIGEVLGYYQKK